MNRNIIYLAVALAALTTASCSKGDMVYNTFKATAETTKENGKQSLNGYRLLWSAEDSVSIYDASSHNALYYVADGLGSSKCELAYHSGSALTTGPYKAVYPSCIHTAADQVMLPAVQHSLDGRLQSLPMYAVSGNEHLMFYNLCGVLRFRLTSSSGKSLSTIAVTTMGTNTHGSATITGQGTAVSLSSPAGGDVSILACDEPQDLSSTKEFYMYLPAGTYNLFRVLLTATDGSVCSKNANGSITVERAKITTITLTNLSFDAYRFSTSATHSVVFAPGNLQYIGSAATPYWRFAARHYDYLGATTGQGSARTDVDRDLFGWGTSGWNNGNAFYMPYCTSNSTKPPYGSSKGNGYGPTNGSAYNYSLTGTYDKADWGVFNPIRNGGNANYQWRTLTYNEWKYLLKTRSASTVNGVANARFIQARVNGLGGLILFPDNYVHPTGVTMPTRINDTAARWSDNVFTDADWTAMDNRGAVFLPASGFRVGTTLKLIGSDGNVWTATNYNTSAAYNIFFCDTMMNTENRGARYVGRSVRLVRD